MKERCLCALCRYADEVDAHLAQLAEPQRAFFVDMYERLCNAENDLDWKRALADARIGTDFPCDSGSGPKGEDAPAAECEASQSGDAEGSASPNPLLSGDSPNG